MSDPIHSLAQQLTGQSTLEESSLDDLKRIVQRYPFFAPAQFLLLQKLRQSGLPEEADAQYRKAVLFYPDPLAFDIFISSGKFFGGETQAVGPSTIDEVASPIEPVDVTSLTGEDSLQTEPASTEVDESLPLPDSLEEESGEVVTVSTTEVPLVSTETIEEDSEENSHVATIEEPIPVTDEPVNLPSLQAPTVQPTEAAVNEPPAFEPYYTVDYFASQGIKMLAEEMPKDKLGKQLKSFTQWLKTMKRLPASQVSDSLNTGVEKSVETMADRSVTQSEVLTEAMAEVWAKQGAHEKALDIYNKLSLHNPSKRDYFAAKIENLKPS